MGRWLAHSAVCIPLLMCVCFFLVSKFDHVCVLLHFAVPMRLHTHTKVFVLFSELRSVSVSLSDAMCPGQAMLSEGWFCKSLGSFPARGDLLNHSTLQTRASDVVAFIRSYLSEEFDCLCVCVDHTGTSVGGALSDSVDAFVSVWSCLCVCDTVAMNATRTVRAQPMAMDLRVCSIQKRPNHSRYLSLSLKPQK